MEMTNSSQNSKIKFTRKKSQVNRKVKEVSLDDDYDLFLEEAKQTSSGLIICGGNKDLIGIKNWIEMPKPFQEMIGAKGIPCGLITMIYGLEDSGKTSFANEILVATQRDDGIAVLFLSELKYDYKRAKSMGIQMDGKRGSLMIYPIKTIEMVGDRIHDFVKILDKMKKKRKVCIVWDSLGAAACENELNEKRADFGMDIARALWGVLRKVNFTIRERDIAFLLINQVRYKTGVTFGKKTTPKGGLAPKYYNTLSLEFTKLGRIRPPGVKAPEPFCGIKTKITVEKNHLGQPFKSLEVGIDHRGFVFDRDAEYTPETSND